MVRKWSVSGNTLRFTPIKQARNLKKFACDFTLSADKLTLRDCSGSGDSGDRDVDWNGQWIFRP